MDGLHGSVSGSDGRWEHPGDTGRTGCRAVSRPSVRTSLAPPSRGRDPIHAVVDPISTPHRAATWRIELLGQVRAVSGDAVVTQFGSRKVAALLARLALFPRRVHSREELVDLLWPEADLDTGRNRLRQALSTLRRLLEPPGAAEVLLADRQSLRLQPGTFSCDVSEFEAELAARRYAAARALYRGELLPGHYDEWILDERQRLEILAERLPPDTDAPHQNETRTDSGVVPEVRLVPVATWRPDRQELLPAYVARFFGRQAEVQALVHMVAAHRLVTLLGPGGSGKTRLSVEVARQARRDYQVVAFVALADCEQPDDLPARLRAALQLPDGQGQPTEQLKLFLQDRPTLLVLDNFEQLVAPGGAPWLGELLQALPALHLLVSSRRRLELDGERNWDLAPLPLPDKDEDLAASAANPSVALFVDRAQAVRPGFQINPHNRADIEALCHALEGIPLAIELAASRAHALSVADMRAQMHRRFALLARKAPRGAGSVRHASLDAALAWSWQLLMPEDQRRLARLSVFRGGWTAAAAAAVWEADDTPETLARLVSDSLVRAELGPDGAMRYQLLEMVREFAAQHLGEGAGARAAHRRWCLALARTHAAVLPLAEVPNLLQALRSGIEDGCAGETLALALATESHWERRGITPEVQGLWREALAQVVAVGQARSPDVQQARCLFARRLYEAGQVATAVELVEQAVAAADGSPALQVPALALRLRMRWESAPRLDDGMSEAIADTLALATAVDDRATQAELLNLLGEVKVLAHRDGHAASVSYSASLALYEALGDQRRAWDVRMGLGICAQVQGRYQEAIRIHGDVVQAATALDDQLLLTDAHNNLAVACNHARLWDRAVHYGRQQLRLATRQYSRYMQVVALWNLARPLARSRQPGLAARLIAFSTTDWERHFGRLSATDWAYVAKVRRLVGAQSGMARAQAWWDDGRRLSLDEVLRLALAEAPLPDDGPRGDGVMGVR